MDTNVKLEDVSYAIKLVQKGWTEDKLAHLRMSFPVGFDKKYNISINAKILVYVTSSQAIVSINEVVGNWALGRQLYHPKGLCLPIQETFKAKVGLLLEDVQQVIPMFQPLKGLSFFPLSQKQFIELESELIKKG